MASISWPQDDLDESVANTTISGLTDMVGAWRQKWQPAAPSAPAAPQPFSFASMLPALTPWSQQDQGDITSPTPKPEGDTLPSGDGLSPFASPGAGAGLSVPSSAPLDSSSKPFSFRDLLPSLTPWSEPKETITLHDEAPGGAPPTPGEPGGPPLATTYPTWQPPGANAQASGPAPSSANAGPIDNSSRAAFVKTAWPYMLEAAGGNRDAAEMMLAAAISENGDVGKGGGFVGNNFFGIKSAGAAGTGAVGAQSLPTWEQEHGQRVNKNQDFAIYADPVSGFGAFMKFLQNNSRYADALANYHKTGDARQLFQGINAAGYASDPDWASAVANIRANQVAPVVASVASTQSMNQTQPSPGLENDQKPAPQRTYESTQDALPTRPTEAPWIEQQRPPDGATMEQPLRPPYPSQTGAAVSGDQMSYRQPLNQQTPGDAFPLTDASVSPPDASTQAPPWEQQTPPPAVPGAGAPFQDDYSQNGQVSPWTQSASQPTAGPMSGPALPPGSTAASPAPISSDANTSTAVRSQQIPNEDQTAYPLPDYRTPAAPLVEAPTTDPAAPPSPYDAGQAASMEPQATRFSGPSESPLKPLYDLGGQIIGYVRAGAEAADRSLNAPVAPPNSPQGRALQSVGIDPSMVRNPIAAVESTARDLPGRLPQVPQINRQAVDEAAREIIQSARAMGQAVNEDDVWGAIYHGAMTGLSAVNAGVNVLGADINALAPEMGAGPVGPGDILVNANLPEDVLNLARGAGRMIAAGRRVTPDVIASLRSGVSDIGTNLRENAGRVAALDAERAGQRGAVSAPGVFGVAPPEAGSAAQDVLQPRFVPPEERMRLGTPREIPDDPRLAQAVESVGGQITDRGIELHVTRAQDETAAGAAATRGGVFMEAVPEGGRSSYARDTPSAGGTGGNQVLPPTQTLYRKPLVLDDAPGADLGFGQAMRQLQFSTPELESLRQARASATADLQESRRFGPATVRRAQVRVDEINARINELTPSVASVDRGIAAARTAGPEGSPARAAALKELVARYGGDPNLIDDLLAIRGADHSESAWAIKENILAANARRQGYDGVFTLQSKEPSWAEIAKHPSMAPFQQVLDDAAAKLDAADQAIQRFGVRWYNSPESKTINIAASPEYKALAQAAHEAGIARNQARDAMLAQGDKIKGELPTSKITEIFDVQQGRNPTPGAPNPKYSRLKQEYDDAQEYFNNVRDAFQSGDADRATLHEARSALADAEEALGAFNGSPYSGQPGYSLHPDVVPPSQGAAATAGIVPVPVRSHTDVLASVNKALGQGAVSAVSGTTTGLVNQEMNPDDPNAFAKGAVVGAVAPYAIARGAGALARRAGREAGQAEGALATLGNAPPSRRFTTPEDALAASASAVGKPSPISPNAGTSRMEALRRWIVRQATDNRVDLAELQKEAQRTLGRPLTAEEMVTEQSRVNPSGASKIVIDERIKPVLQGLDTEKPAVTLPNGQTLTQREALTQAMILTNNRDVAVALEAPDRVFSGGLTGADSEAALQHLISSMAPEDQRAVAGGMRDLNGVVESYRQKLVDAGVWSQDFADEMRSKYPNWVPTKILDYMADADKGSGVTSRSISLRDRGVRQYTMEGTLKSREDPIASLIRYVDESEARIQKNEVFNGFANLYDALKANPDSGWANMVKEVPNSTTAAAGRGERTVQGFVDGERRTFIASPSVAAAVRMEQGAQIPIIREVTSLFRELITRTPVFVAGQIPLDFMAGAVRTSNLEGGPQHVPKVAAEIVKGYAEAFRGLLSNEFKGDAARYMKEGGAMAGFYERGIDAAHHTVDSLTRRHMFEINNAGDAANLAKWLAGGGWVQAVGQRVELAPRIAAFRLGEQRALKAGADPATAALQGAMAGRNVTMDFQVGGTASKVINQAVPFFNVGVQSSVTLARMARENPKAFPFTMMALVAAPTVAAEAWNRSDPQRAQDYADVPDYVKDRGIVFMLPGVEGKGRLGERKPNYAIIPLRELAPIAILTRELAANAMRASGMHGEEGPRGWGALLGATVSAASPVQANSAADLFSSVNPVGLNTVHQLATNYDDFRGRQIATRRNDENASALSAGIANAATAVTGKDVRPSQVEFGIRDTTGGVGAAVLAGSNLATGRTRQEERIQNTPGAGGLIGRFVGDASGGNLQRAQEKMQSPELTRLARSAGMRPDEIVGVDSLAGQIPLTQQEQARAQVLMNQYLADLIKRGVTSGPQWDASPPEARQNYVRGLVTAARSSAESQVAGPLSSDERQRRITAMKPAS